MHGSASHHRFRVISGGNYLFNRRDISHFYMIIEHQCILILIGGSRRGIWNTDLLIISDTPPPSCSPFLYIKWIIRTRTFSFRHHTYACHLHTTYFCSTPTHNAIMTSLVDQVYRSFVISKFFSRGWGRPEQIKRLFDFRKNMANRESCMKLVDHDHPIVIDKVRLLDCFQNKHKNTNIHLTLSTYVLFLINRYDSMTNANWSTVILEAHLPIIYQVETSLILYWYDEWHCNKRNQSIRVATYRCRNSFFSACCTCKWLARTWPTTVRSNGRNRGR